MFTPLKNILNTNIKKAGIDNQVEAAQVIKAFNELIVTIFRDSPEAKALYFRKKNLTVGCESSAFIQEMYLNKKKIIRELNQKLGREIVKSLKFRI